MVNNLPATHQPLYRGATQDSIYITNGVCEKKWGIEKTHVFRTTKRQESAKIGKQIHVHRIQSM